MINRLPEDFEREFRVVFGTELFSRVIGAIKEEAPVLSVRTNRLKAVPLSSESADVSWLSGQGMYVSDERPVFGADPFWHVGAYYVQEAGSMFIAKYLEYEKPEVILDLCAAPGGKSTLLRDFFTPRETLTEPLLICNEPVRERAKVLQENVLRWSGDETIVTSALPDALAASGLSADLILVDAPCSGEGMFRKDPASIDEWSQANVSLCVSRQRDILSSAWEILTEGGLLIYSTCTLNPKENEEQLSWLEEHYDLELVTLASDFDDLCLLRKGVYRFMPGFTRSEGLSVFAVRKRAQTASAGFSKPVKPQKFPTPDELKGLPHSFCVTNGIYSLLSPKGQETLSLLSVSKGIRIRSTGLPLGEMKGKDFIPSQGWVTSGVFSLNLPYPRIEVTEDTALSILKKETPVIDAPGRGIYLLTYQGLPLSLVKHLGTRINNLYPKEWAVRNARLTSEDIPHLPIRISGLK